MLTLKLNSLVLADITDQIWAGLNVDARLRFGYQGVSQHSAIDVSTRHGNCRGPLAEPETRKKGNLSGDNTSAIGAGRSFSYSSVFHHPSSWHQEDRILGLTPRFWENTTNGAYAMTLMSKNLARVSAMGVVGGTSCRIPPRMMKDGGW